MAVESEVNHAGKVSLNRLRSLAAETQSPVLSAIAASAQMEEDVEAWEVGYRFGQGMLARQPNGNILLPPCSVELTRFRGHLTFGVGGSHDAEEEVRTTAAVPT